MFEKAVAQAERQDEKNRLALIYIRFAAMRQGADTNHFAPDTSYIHQRHLPLLPHRGKTYVARLPLQLTQIIHPPPGPPNLCVVFHTHRSCVRTNRNRHGNRYFFHRNAAFGRGLWLRDVQTQ